jgi:hypothetical protein
MFKVFVIAFLLVSTQAEIFNRQCRTVEEYGGPVRNFIPSLYVGHWFQIER